jgi:ABC-type sugar transport system ATPase subunit
MNVIRDLHGHAVAGVRPEHVELAGEAGPSAERRIGRVQRCVFLGSITRVTLDVDGAPITIELPGRRDDLAPDREIALRIPAHAVLNLGDSQ